MNRFGLSLRGVTIAVGGLVLGAILLRLLGALGLGSAAQAALALLGFVAVVVWCCDARQVSEARAFPLPGDATFAPGIAAETVSAAAILAVPVLILSEGVAGLALIGGLLAGGVIAHRALGPALARSGAGTLPELFERRCGGAAANLARAVIMLLALLTIAVQLGATGLVVESFAELPGWAVMLLCAFGVLAASLPGGARSALATGSLAAAALLFGVLVAATQLAGQEAGRAIPQLAPGPLLHEIAVQEARLGLTERFMQISPPALILGGVAVALGAAMLPGSVLRWGALPGGVRRGAGASIALAALILMALPVFAVLARVGMLASGDAVAPLPPRESAAALIASLELPGWCRALLALATLAAGIAAASVAAVSFTTATGQHRRSETAGSALMRCRLVLAAGVAVALALALLRPIGIVDAFLALLALAAGALLAPTVFALFWRGTTSAGCIAGILAGGAATLALLLHHGVPVPLEAGLPSVPASALALWLVSLATRQPRGSALPIAPSE